MFSIKHKDFIEKNTRKYGSCVFVNKQAILDNYDIMDKQLKNSHIISVLKNDAYHFGIENIAPLIAQKNKEFFVATIQEAIKLRQMDESYIVYVLHGPLEDQIEDFESYNLIPVLSTIDQVKIWYEYAKTKDSRLKALLHIETGINRIGLTEDNIIAVLKDKYLDTFEILYVISHFSSSDLEKHPSTEEQYHTFVKLTDTYFKGYKLSLSASFGIFTEDKYHFDAVRPGIALYGGNPQPYKENIMKNVLYIYSSILQVKDIKKGESVGYACKWTAERNSKIAVIPFGYADGIPHTAMKNGYVLINKQKAPIIGTISMDLTTIDVTDINPADLSVGNIVEITGDNLHFSVFAEQSKSNYCGMLNILTTRYPRYYI